MVTLQEDVFINMDQQQDPFADFYGKMWTPVRSQQQQLEQVVAEQQSLILEFPR